MEKKTLKPILMDELNVADRTKLAQTVLTPGWSVVIRMIESVCDDSRVAINDVDPEEENYEHVLKAVQQYSRAVNKMSALLLKSIEWHVAQGIVEEAETDERILERVNPERTDPAWVAPTGEVVQSN